MAISINHVPPVSDAAAKGKEPAEKAVYLPDLPLDIRKLITPYLVTENRDLVPKDLDVEARDRNAKLRGKCTLDALSEELAKPIVDQCRNTVERIQLYREIALDKGEHLPDPENLEEISRYLKTYDSAVTCGNIRNGIVKGQFTATVTPSTFKYADGRAQISGMTGVSLDGYLAAQLPLRNAIFFRTSLADSPSNFKSISLYSIRDFTLAPGGILFVAIDRFLEIYDLTQPSHFGFIPTDAKWLHQLDHRFDRITWDLKRACLIGEKEGQVTELKFEPSAPEAPSKAKPHMSGKSKIAYTAKRILKIIVVEGPENAFKETKKGLELLSLSKRKLIITVGLGALGVGLLAAGLAVSFVAPPIFAILAVPACAIGGGLIGWAIRPLILPSVFGTIMGIADTFSSLNDLRREVFSG